MYLDQVTKQFYYLHVRELLFVVRHFAKTVFQSTSTRLFWIVQIHGLTSSVLLVELTFPYGTNQKFRLECWCCQLSLGIVK